jgi:hypothetical protein
MITTIIPVYNLDANRKRNLEFIYERLKEQLPNSKIIISVQSSIYDENKYYEKFDEVVYFKNNFNTFNKSALINYSLNNIKIKSDFVMLLDGDVYFKFKSLEDQIPLLSEEKVIKPFSECVYLTESHTFEFINKRKINLTGGFKKISALGGGAIILKSSLVKDPAVRYDENFSGWGWEDIDFGDSIRSKFSIKTLQQPAIHLYHPVTVESSRNNYVYYNAKNKPKNKIVHTFSHACVDQEHRLHAAQTNALQSFFIAKKNLDVLLLNACSEFCINNDNIKTVQLNKTAKDIGYNRDLPYLDDVINFAIPYVEDSGWIVYTNSDCIVKDEFYEDILKYNYDYIEFKRQDVDAKGNHIRSISRGVDGFAIRKKILEQTPMPKLIIGAPYWDDVVSKIYSKSAYKFMTINNELIHLDHKATYNLDKLDIAGKFNYDKLVNLVGLEEKNKTPDKDKLSLESFEFTPNKLECICILLTKNEIDNGSYEEFIDRLKQNTTTKEASGVDFRIITNKHINKNQLRVDVLKSIFKNIEIINLKLTPQEDLYIKEVMYSLLFVPKYGTKSGPNLMFLKSIRECKKYNTILLMETDCFVKNKWLSKIKNFVVHSNGFWISGATYDGTVHCKSGSYMMTHINGGTGLYATGNKNFQIFLDKAEEFIINKIKNMPYLAYDCGIKMFIDENIDKATKVEDILLWKLINRQYLPNKLIGNFSIDKDQYLKTEDIDRMCNYYIIHKK